MPEVQWRDEWGTKEEYGVLEGTDSLEGYKVGEEIRLNQDTDDGYTEGEEGTVVGIAEVGSSEYGTLSRKLLVEFEGCDPVTVDPYIVDAVDDLYGD